MTRFEHLAQDETPPGRVLVLGYGNPGRGDDGLGPAAVEAIEQAGWKNVSVSSNYQLVPEDIVEIAGAKVVWFIDACKTGPESFEVRPSAPFAEFSFTSHHMTPEGLLALTELYYGHRPEAHILAIRGYHFAFHEGLSRRAAGNLDQALAFLQERIGCASAASAKC
jgi:hydrogenase maturation protease